MGRNERRWLVREGRRALDIWTATRFLIVARLGLGKSSPEVADEVDVSRSTVVRTAQSFAREGVAGLYDKRRHNGLRKTEPAFDRAVAKLLRGTAQNHGWTRPTWTRELLCLQMCRDGWPAVAPSTMGRVLARLGARLGAPKPVVLCPWKRPQRLERLAQLRALEARASSAEPVLYVDEVDLHLNPKVGRDWMLPGCQRRLVTPGKNEKFYLAGALDVRSGALITTGAPRKDAALFCDLLKLLSEQFAGASRIHIILDNFAIHSAKRTLRALEDLGGRVVLHFLPPYCPDANRIERVWQDLHANVTRNHCCRTMRALLAKARDYLLGYVRGQRTGVAVLLDAPA